VKNSKGVVLVCAVIAFAVAGDLLSDVTPSVNRLMAITVDDLPVAQPSWHSNEQMDRITSDLLAIFEKHRVPAVGFVNEGKLAVDGKIDVFRLQILQRWLDAGLELGNHGHSHLDLHRVAPGEWMADVVRGEPETRKLMEEAGHRLRYFRHPFLHTGMSIEIQEETSDFLGSRGYTVAPVTIDNSEWVYGRAYSRPYNENDEEMKRKIGEDYVRYMLEVVEYYEGQSMAIAGRAIKQVLLVHAYALNAEWLDELLGELEKRGYRWISLEEALEDPVYDRPIDGWTGRGGITWLHRWAITEGLDRTIFTGEPEPPGWIADRER
jgi:peptidoglycan/xylan/chitin deacetylase (PgdA/CDA1 family)